MPHHHNKHQPTTTTNNPTPLSTLPFLILTIVADIASIGLTLGSLLSPWMISTNTTTCTTTACPPTSITVTNNANIQWSIFDSGSFSGPSFTPLDEFVIPGLNDSSSHSNLTTAMTTVAGWYIAPSTVVAWSEMNTEIACTGIMAQYWGQLYGFCNSDGTYVGTDPNLIAVQATIIMSIIFQSQSFMMIIAARKGMLGYAMLGCCASSMAFICLVMSIALFYASWGYPGHQLATFVATVPLRAMAPDGFSFRIFPVAVSMIRGPAFYLLVFAILGQALATLLAWFIATERFIHRKTKEEKEQEQQDLPVRDNSSFFSVDNDDDDAHHMSTNGMSATERMMQRDIENKHAEWAAAGGNEKSIIMTV